MPARKTGRTFKLDGVRVSQETAQLLAALSALTGRSMSDLTDALLRPALRELRDASAPAVAA